jgi:hypothetical protein
MFPTLEDIALPSSRHGHKQKKNNNNKQNIQTKHTHTHTQNKPTPRLSQFANQVGLQRNTNRRNEI